MIQAWKNRSDPDEIHLPFCEKHHGYAHVCTDAEGQKYRSVFFEKENLDTLSMKGELMLTILSSLPQQDVETVSSNVKMDLMMKMKHGELVGYNGCLGYDYHREDKTITLNEQGAETVRMIYDLYLQGYETRIIAKRLTELGLPNKEGVVQWTESETREKYTRKYAFSSMCVCGFCGSKCREELFTVIPSTRKRCGTACAR